MHLKTIAFGAGMLTAVGLIVMCKPASKLMKDVKTSVEDYMEKMKKKSCTCNAAKILLLKQEKELVIAALSQKATVAFVM